MVVRRVLTEPKTVLAGVMFEISSLSFKDSMAAFNTRIVPSRPVGRWASTSMVEVQGSWERTVRREGSEDGSET